MNHIYLHPDVLQTEDIVEMSPICDSDLEVSDPEGWEDEIEWTTTQRQ